MYSDNVPYTSQEWMSDSLSKGFYNGKPNPFEVRWSDGCYSTDNCVFSISVDGTDLIMIMIMIMWMEICALKYWSMIRFMLL